MLPRVILHNALSVDGRMDWVTPDLGQFYDLASRFAEDATLVGSNTVLTAMGDADEEEASLPTEEGSSDTRPLLVIPDSRGRVRNWQYLRKQPYWRAAVALCSRSTPEEYLRYLREQHVDCITTGDDHADLRTALEELNARYGVKTVRADCGGTLNGALLRAGLVDEISILIDPILIGGNAPRYLFQAPDLTSAEGVIRLKLAHVEKLKADTLWLRYEIVRSQPSAGSESGQARR